MNVFIAGATNIGFEKSQARIMQVRRLSHKPPATCKSLEASDLAKNLQNLRGQGREEEIMNMRLQEKKVETYKQDIISEDQFSITFASVFAERGAISIASAHFRSSMWSTLSPILLQLDHSSSSVYSFTPAGRAFWSIKCKEGFVATALTSAQSDRLSARIPNLIAATLPLAARMIRGFLLTARFSNPNDEEASGTFGSSGSEAKSFASDVTDSMSS